MVKGYQTIARRFFLEAWHVRFLVMVLLVLSSSGCETIKEEMQKNPAMAGVIGTLGGAAAGAGIGAAVGGSKGAKYGAIGGAVLGLLAAEIYYFNTRQVGPRQEVISRYKTDDGLFIENTDLKKSEQRSNQLDMKVRYAMVDPDPKAALPVTIEGAIQDPQGNKIPLPRKTTNQPQGIQESSIGIGLPADVAPGTYIVQANVSNEKHRVASPAKSFSLYAILHIDAKTRLAKLIDVTVLPHKTL